MSLITSGLGSLFLVTRGFNSVSTTASPSESFYSFFAAQVGLVAAVYGGAMYLVEAPQGTTLPYAEYFEVSDTWDQTTGPYVGHTSIQVSCYASDPDAAKALGIQFASAFHKATLPSINGVPVAHCLRTGGLLTKADGKGPGGKDCWVQTNDFDIMYPSA